MLSARSNLKIVIEIESARLKEKSKKASLTKDDTAKIGMLAQALISLENMPSALKSDDDMGQLSFGELQRIASGSTESD